MLAIHRVKPSCGLASPKALGTVRRIPAYNSQPGRKQVNRSCGDAHPSLNMFGFPAMASRSSNESVMAQASGSAQPSPAHGLNHASAGLMQKNMHVTDVLQRERETQGESWDDDFAADISLSRLNRELLTVPPLSLPSLMFPSPQRRTCRRRKRSENSQAIAEYIFERETRPESQTKSSGSSSIGQQCRRLLRTGRPRTRRCLQEQAIEHEGKYGTYRCKLTQA